MSKNLLVSFSGGRTSGFMSKLIKDEIEKNYDKVLYIFANTSREDDRTLEFVDKVDKYFGLNLVWVEADVKHGKREGTSFRVTDYENAKRDASVFRDVISKYGIPNQSYPHCTRELKLQPIHKYAKEYFNGEKYEVAIGIRDDEKRRVAKNAESMYGGIIYPLIDYLPTDKQDINDFWDTMPFNLEIPEHYGNCVTCWKKSDRKIWTIMQDDIKLFDFEKEMEFKYGHIHQKVGENKHVFWRRKRSTHQMEEEMKACGFDKFVDSRFNRDIDENSGCSESCELYPTL